MTNDELDRLTALAYDVHVRLTPELMLDGRGAFRAPDGSQVSSADVLARMTQSGELAHRLHGLLGAIPRRRRAAKGGDHG